MPISHQHKTIFIHIPKTAGTSIEKELGICGVDNQGSNEACYPLLFGNDGNRYLQHLLGTEILALVGPTMFRDYFKFAIVRNPFARLLSAYKGYYHREEPDFNRFVKRTVSKIAARPLRKDPARHLKPQTAFLFDEEEAQLVDFIGRQEALDQDIAAIEQRLAVSLKLNKPAQVRSNSYREAYAPEARRIVEKVYASDLERFEYVF
jgi:hypothetical protein